MPTESGLKKQVGVRGQKGPGVVKGKGKEKAVVSGKSGWDEIQGIQEMVEEMAEEIKGMKRILKKIYETGQMMWGEVVDLNDELELGYESSEAGMEV